MTIWLTLLALAQAGNPAELPDPLIVRARALTSVAARCDAQPNPDEVVVCARRRADAYRLPFVGSRTGGTRADPTPDERLAGIRPRTECENLSPFLVGCGSVGVGIGLASDGSSRTFTARERTPDIVR